METKIRIAHKDGGDLGYYSDRKEFINDVEGSVDFTFGVELLNVGKTFKYKNQILKVEDISIELQGVLNGEKRIDYDDNDVFSKTNIEVVVFIDYL